MVFFLCIRGKYSLGTNRKFGRLQFVLRSSAAYSLSLIVLLTVFRTFDVSSQIQLGANLLGSFEGDRFGWSVSMPDETTVAIGARLNDENGTNAGQVKVFAWDGSIWSQKGAALFGDAEGDEFGRAVWMADSNSLAIGANGNDNNGNASGHVKVYTWDGTAWIQRGADISGESSGDQSGYAIAMPDPNTVAIGSPQYNSGDLPEGHVRVFSWSGSEWLQKGNTIQGEWSGDRSGWSLSMPDANTLAIGAPFNAENGSVTGHARVFFWNGMSWEQKGEDIDGLGMGDEFGFSLCMPEPGILAVGGRYNDGNGINSGHVRVFQWDGVTWVQKGADIYGAGEGELAGWSVSMPDSNTLAVGAVHLGTPGKVRLYEWGGVSWMQQGATIEGAGVGDNFGHSTCMSTSNTLAVGAPANGENGANAGLVGVYTLQLLEGCSDVTACNYDPEANSDNGSCIYPPECYNCDGDLICIPVDAVQGCTYPEAANYNPAATIDNGSCAFSCAFDTNGDGVVSSADLLNFLTLFGSACP